MKRALLWVSAIAFVVSAIAVLGLRKRSESGSEGNDSAQGPGETGLGSSRAHDARSSGPSGIRIERGSPPIVERIARIRELGVRKDVQALPWLTRSVLADQPEVAPTLITAVAEIATAAPDADRDLAAAALGEWLEVEAGREGADARGNVALLVEALAITGSPVAVDALADTLDRQRLPLHIETTAVEGLFRLADPRALAAVQRFRSRVESLPPASGIDEELRKEAVLTARAAAANLGS